MERLGLGEGTGEGERKKLVHVYRDVVLQDDVSAYSKKSDIFLSWVQVCRCALLTLEYV